MPGVISHAFLINRSPCLQHLSLEILQRTRREVAPSIAKASVSISRALVNLGIVSHPIQYARMGPTPRAGINDTVPAEWLAWTRRWLSTSPLSKKTRECKFVFISKIGRWLAASHPTVTNPTQWTRETAAECVAAISQMNVGEWVHPQNNYIPSQILGKPLAPNSKAGQLSAIRTFFIDCQEWGWIPIRFDPRRSLALPKNLVALQTRNPRVIADDVWAKLINAGLNLTEEDLPVCTYRAGTKLYPKASWYPIELVRAVTITWLFTGLRSDEIYRLRTGCVRWQKEFDTADRPSVCLLDVPVNKTNTAFTKPVDRLVGEAIENWQKMRPPTAAQLDRKNGELVDFLFMYRSKRVGKSYLNKTVIPILCQKAGVARSDARGPITSHRARSTIATQLYNAREPMSIFELQEWLGHREVSSTQYYAKITPLKLTQAYKKAGYFERNLRTIEVLIDQEVIKSGAAARGEPWKFYDLGHGYCTYDFFDQYPHRMACAKCSFYRPKGSSQAQLLEGSANLQRMLQAIPLTDDERAAVEEGVEAMERLSEKLRGVPTPADSKPTDSSSAVTNIKDP